MLRRMKWNMNTNAGTAGTGTATGTRGTRTTTARSATTSATAEMRNMGDFTTQAKVAPPASSAEYILYADGIPKGIYERLSAAVSAAERITAQNIHILDENNDKVIEIKYSDTK